jgi:hypothetical protein
MAIISSKKSDTGDAPRRSPATKPAVAPAMQPDPDLLKGEAATTEEQVAEKDEGLRPQRLPLAKNL